jgi:hypothetical protein
MPLSLIEDPGAQPIAQLDASLGATHGIPSLVPLLYPHAHQLAFPGHLDHEDLAREDPDWLSSWGPNGPLARGLHLQQGALYHHCPPPIAARMPSRKG